jgi:hypothetical protein
MPENLETVDRWFFGWLEYHQKINPGKWVRATDFGARDVYLGWMEAFAKAKATDDVARLASRRLQSVGPGYPSSHLSKLLPLIADVRREQFTARDRDPGAASPEAARAQAASADCPECKGEGWARRKLFCRPVPRAATVVLFCRCPMGRHLKAHDPELTRGERVRLHDDLQAQPDLWDPSLWHPSWSEWPCDHDLNLSPDDAARVRYVLPGEDVAAVAPSWLARDVARTIAVRSAGVRRVVPRPRPQGDPILDGEPAYRGGNEAPSRERGE